MANFLIEESKMGRRKIVTKERAWRKYNESEGLNVSRTVGLPSSLVLAVPAPQQCDPAGGQGPGPAQMEG